MVVHMEPGTPGEGIGQSEEAEGTELCGEGEKPVGSSSEQDGGDGGSSWRESAKKWLKKNWRPVVKTVALTMALMALTWLKQEPERQAEQIDDRSDSDWGAGNSYMAFDDAPEENQACGASPLRKSPTCHEVGTHQRRQHFGPGNEYEKTITVQSYSRGVCEQG